MAAYLVVWECVVEQWLGVRRVLSNKRVTRVITDYVLKCFKIVLCEILCPFVG